MALTPGVGDPTVVIALPMFDDWAALARLLPLIDAALQGNGLRAPVLVIDDASSQPPPAGFGTAAYDAIEGITILRLRRNLGHQRAIAIGLAHIERHVACDAVVLMDADGEDDPADIPRLIDRYRREHGSAVVFAERRRRVESLPFRIFYHAYRALHRVLTGQSVRVGNFSVIPRARLSALVVVSELWNHYSAAVFRSRQPSVMVSTARSRRLAGRSHMNVVSLVIHGMSAISVYGDVVFVRLVVFASTLAALAIAGLVIVGAFLIWTEVVIPTWAAIVSGLLVLILLQAIMFIASLTFLGLSSRQQAPFVPMRDFELYVESAWPIARFTRGTVLS
jgi:polyisoprenyl-phosphate glycosyltransferase